MGDEHEVAGEELCDESLEQVAGGSLIETCYCPACGQNTSFKVTLNPSFSMRLKMYRCTACGGTNHDKPRD